MVSSRSGIAGVVAAGSMRERGGTALSGRGRCGRHSLPYAGMTRIRFKGSRLSENGGSQLPVGPRIAGFGEAPPGTGHMVWEAAPAVKGGAGPESLKPV